MLTLILMRHAKSSWDSPTLSDHDRPLNNRGRASAQALGDWLRSKSYAPDQALVSSAHRTQETYTRLNLTSDVTHTKDLYHAGSDVMLSVLKTATGSCVLVLGHNPGIAEFAERIVKIRPSHPRFMDYPTGATLVVTFGAPNWSAVTWNSGTPIDFVVPRTLISDT